MAQRISLPLTVSCFRKIQIGFTFLVLAHPGSPGQRAVKRVCVCVCVKRPSTSARTVVPLTTPLGPSPDQTDGSAVFAGLMVVTNGHRHKDHATLPM